MLRVTWHEFFFNLRSVRLLIMLVVLALVVVGAAYGIGRGTGGGGPSLSPLAGWGHAAIGPTGGRVAVVWVSDPFGVPLSDASVDFSYRENQTQVQLGSVRTDADGFARLAVPNRTFIEFSIHSGNAGFGSGILFDTQRYNFTMVSRGDDLDNDGLSNDVGIHVLNLAGTPTSARLYVNGTFVTTVDPHGYGRLKLPPGRSNFTVEVAGERQTQPYFVNVDPVRPPFSTGPDFVLLIIAGGLAAFVLPIFAIVISFDAVSKERVQGTLDLLLSRPVSRVGLALGKFTGAFSAVAVPVTLVNLVGIGVLTLASGKSPTGSFAGAFVGLSLLLVAFYVPIQLTFSTLAKTSGTAILFGVLIWLALNILYPVITTVLSFVLFPNNFESQFRFLQVSGLGNPTAIYQQLIGFAAPEALGRGFGPFGGTTLTLPVVASAAAAWLVGLLALSVWTVHRKIAD
jgi:ABC-type transport system involved in multi-copper enzyme maturation permease subunit